MNKAITEGLALMPPEFSAGLKLWSREDGLTGQGSYLGQPNAAFVPNDQDFGGCLELEKTSTTQKLRCFQSIPYLPGLYLRVTARVKVISGAFPSVRIAGWAGRSATANVDSADQIGPSVTLDTYGEIVTVTAIIGSGNRTGVDMIWGRTPVLGHFGLDLTGANGAVVRIDDITIEDVSSIFHSVQFDWVDVRDYGAIGDGVTDDKAAFDAADVAANGKRLIVPPGSYFIGSNLTIDNPVQFEGTLVMANATRLALVRNYDLANYTAAMGSELVGFKKALQALFYFTDHVELNLNGRRVELTAPIDVAALAGLTEFAERRVLSNGQIAVLTNSSWADTVVTSGASYNTGTNTRLSNVVNVNAIPVGARITGTGVGREVYVRARNVGAGTLELSQPLWGGNATNRNYTFTKHEFMLDFSGFEALSKFEIQNIEFQGDNAGSCLMLAKSGQRFVLQDSVLNRPKDKGITSIYKGCQDLVVQNCEFISPEMSTPAQNRTSIVMNVNANDSKIRNNRAVRFGTTAVMAGAGHMFVGNHFFQGDDTTSGVRRAGIVLSEPNCKTYITGNYIDNCTIEWGNEHDGSPDFASEFTFGGLTLTGNTFTVQGVAPGFRWFVLKPYGTGHSLQGLSVIGNVFRTISSNIDRVEAVDTTHADLSYISFKNVTFSANSYNGITQPTASPVLIQHTQNTAADTWTVDSDFYLPFGSRARNVQSITFEGAVRNTSNVTQFVTPFTQNEQGAGGRFVQLKFGSAVTGTAWVTLRCDNPL
jgi:hypothetical protein